MSAVTNSPKGDDTAAGESGRIGAIAMTCGRRVDAMSLLVSALFFMQ